MEGDFDIVGEHANENVRAWMIRLIGDDEKLSETTLAAFNRLAATDKSYAVVAQMACTARRFSPQQEIAIVDSLLENPLLSDDPQLPLLVWWAQEDANRRDTSDTVRFTYPSRPNQGLEAFFNERVAHRLLSGNIPRGTERVGTIFALAKEYSGDLKPVLRGVATAHPGVPAGRGAAVLCALLAELLQQNPKDLLVLEVLARMKDAPARATLRGIVADDKTAEATRLKAIDLLRQVRDPRSEELFLELFAGSKSDSLRMPCSAGWKRSTTCRSARRC